MTTAHKYGDHVDTDVIIPARYLASQDEKELASHCMEDLDKTFVIRVKSGDIISFVAACVAPLNLIKGASVSFVTLLVYKPLSPIIKSGHR